MRFPARPVELPAAELILSVRRDTLPNCSLCLFNDRGPHAIYSQGAHVQLIGMLDSPYVRRVAISLQLLGLPFVHRPLSVFRSFDEFHSINPVVKAPTLVCDDGEILMDSTLILDYAEGLAVQLNLPRSLRPGNVAELQRMLPIVGLALAACEKSVQLYYEHNLRPAEKQHEPWVTRVTGQLLAACEALETTLRNRPLSAHSTTINLAGVSVAVAWQFVQQMLPDIVPASDHPALCVFSTKAESLPAFKAAPHGAGTYCESL